MNYRFLLAIIPLFLCLNTVLATDITSCYNITTSGYYQFTGNITVNNAQCGFGLACIQINASSVTLDMKGYSLINNGSCYYGIIVLPKNSGDYSVQHTGINIYNGRIINFIASGIENYGSTDASSYTFIDFYGNNIGVGNGVVLDTGYDTNLMIGEDYFYKGNNAVLGNCLSSCKIYDNEIKFFTAGLYLYGNNFDVQRNLMGFTTRNDTGCFKQDFPIEFGIFCNDCNNTIIRNNDIMSDNALYLTNHAHGNNITYNIFRTFYNYQPVISFDSTTSNNVFCSNLLISSIPTLVNNYGVETCYWGTDTKNAMDSVQDADSNSLAESCTSNCQAGWFCQNDMRVYLETNCTISENYTCEYGCESGIYGAYCIGNYLTSSTTTTTVGISGWNNTVNQPVVNQTDLNEAGLNWMTPFFTPVFLIITFELIFSGLISWIAKQPIAFPITIFFLTALLGYFGMFSLGITLMLCIISALSTALLYKTLVK
jgi:hypothetical protein